MNRFLNNALQDRIDLVIKKGSQERLQVYISRLNDELDLYKAGKGNYNDIEEQLILISSCFEDSPSLTYNTNISKINFIISKYADTINGTIPRGRCRMCQDLIVLCHDSKCSKHYSHRKVYLRESKAEDNYWACIDDNAEAYSHEMEA